VETDGALDIAQGFLESVPFAYDHALNACGISHITVRMFFDDDFHLSKLNSAIDEVKILSPVGRRCPAAGRAAARPYQ
jgi:hypothetical protein